MDPSYLQDSVAVAGAFLQQYAQDRNAGRTRSLAEYQARFPGFEDVIAAEFGALRTDVDAGETAADPSGSTDDRPVAREGRDPARYRILEEIGKGGMGRVYHVWERDLRRPVAMKVLSGETDGTGAGSHHPLALRRMRQSSCDSDQVGRDRERLDERERLARRPRERGPGRDARARRREP